MRLLILGGTVFVGRALTDAALAAGHDVQHVNRGRTQPPDPRVQTLHADRADPAALREALSGHTDWDAVIDTSGYLPQVVRESVQALRGRTRRYCFISTISVYASFSTGGFDEDAPVLPTPDPLPGKLEMELYGALKAGCEEVVRAGFGEGSLVIRPGLIVGPHDPTDRFTYWPMRFLRGGTVLAPGRPQRPVQLIDVRDLADWTVSALERDLAGTFNATGPASPLTMGELLATARVVAESEAELEWVPDEFLVAKGAGAWKELPLWIPEADPMAGLMGASNARALRAGLRFRPLDVTLQATLEWARTRPADHAWKAGLTPEREAELLASWQARE